MPEGRMIKKVVSTSRKLAALKTDAARLLYTWLLPHLDIEGRFSAESSIVRGYIVPRLTTMTASKITRYLEDMANNKLIVLYKHNGDSYLEVVKFQDFQTLRSDREAASIIPPPTDSNTAPALLPELSGLSKVKQSKAKESKEKEKEKGGRFTPPTSQEVQDQIDFKEYKTITPDGFIEFYGSKGWMVGKNKMTNWKLALARADKWDASPQKGEQSGKQGSKTKLFPIAGKTCSIADCCLPAVYKNTAGAYDHYSCLGHSPKAVQEKYCE